MAVDDQQQLGRSHKWMMLALGMLAQTATGVFVNGVCELQNMKIDELGDGYSLNFLSYTVNWYNF